MYLNAFWQIMSACIETHVICLAPGNIELETPPQGLVEEAALTT